MTGAVRALVAAAVVAGTAAVTLVTAAPASAATYDEATWYYTNFHLAENLATANGSGVSVAVIDGSIDPSVPELANAKIETHPSQCLLNGSTDPVVSSADATHGTNIAVMLAGNGTGNWDGRGGKGVAPGATILYYRNGTLTTAGSPDVQCRDAAGNDIYDAATANAVNDAVAKGARVVSMSFGSGGDMTATATAMADAERKGVVFVAATDDHAKPYDPSRVSAPGIYNGVVLVNGSTPTNQLAPNSSTSDLVTVLAPGDTLCLGGFNPATGKWDSTGIASGSSFGTPFTAGVIADAMSRYPKATGNQILQLLVRTTGGDLHDIPSRQGDGFGFGAPSLTAMFEHDPSQLPDQNPLLRDDATPSTSDITGDASSPASSAAPSGKASGAATSSTPPTTSASSTKDDGSSSLPLVLGVAALVVVLIAVLVVVLVLRSRRRPPGGGTPPGSGGTWSGPSSSGPPGPYPPGPYPPGPQPTGPPEGPPVHQPVS